MTKHWPKQPKSREALEQELAELREMLRIAEQRARVAEGRVFLRDIMTVNPNLCTAEAIRRAL